MSETDTELLKTVEAVFQNKYIIPEYQRGYKWTAETVTQLLNDIHNFTPKEANFYCLQNITVIKGNDAYEVIDGQQRFTTLYLAAFYFSLLTGKTFEYNKKFSYRVRNSTAEFLTLLLDEVKSPAILPKLEDQTWFLSSYRKDPSINNICSLFKWLNEKYKQFSKPEAEEMLKKMGLA